MMIGVIAISVEAIPAAVYCTAIKENPTPTKGPKIVVATATPIPFRSWSTSRSGKKPSRIYNNKVKPMIPATQRKKLALKGTSHAGIAFIS